MKVLFHTTQDGQAFHRVHTPAKFITESLKAKGIELVVATGFNSVDEYDAFIIQRLPTPAFMPILKEIKEKRKKFIWSTDDDLWNLPKNNPASKVYDRDAIERVDYCFWAANHVISSTIHLKHVMMNRYLDWEDKKKRVELPIIVLPNLIDLDCWNDSRTPHHKTRICFAGSAYHNDDLNMIAPVIEQIIRSNDVVAVFFGDAPDTMIYWKRVVGDVIAEMQPLEKYNDKLHIVKPVHIHLFPKALMALSPDISICPLTNAEFNESKSNLKYLEYSMSGSATIAQKSKPYANSKCLKASNNKEWLEHLTYLIKNPNERLLLSIQAKNDVIENYSWQNKAQLWIDAFTTMLIS